MNAGLTKTPLIKKLGLKEAMRACILTAPPHYLDLLGPLPGGAVLLDHPDDGLDFIQLFAQHQRTLQRQLTALSPAWPPPECSGSAGPRKSPRSTLT